MSDFILSLVNDYGALLNMHEHEIRSDIQSAENRLKQIDVDIDKLQLESSRLKKNIEVMNIRRKLYLEMIELIGRPK